MRAEIVEQYGELSGDSPPVAVRSSAVGEDSQDATFAGQQETYLWVRGVEHVCDAVRDWVKAGGALLLIADHAPMGAANQSLAKLRRRLVLHAPTKRMPGLWIGLTGSFS